MQLGGGGGQRGRRRTRIRVTKRTTLLGVARAVDFANRADIPLTVDTNMAQVVAFKARFVVTRVVTGEWGINRYAMDSSHGIDFVTKFSALEGQLDLRGKWRGGSGWERLGVGRCSQFFDVSF